MKLRGGARWLDLAVDGDRLPGQEFVFEIRRIKPDALEGVAALADGELEERHAARAQQSRAAHFADDAGHFARLQFVEADGILAVLIAEGKVVEQILGGQDAFFGEHLGDGGTDAAHILHLIAEGGHIWMLNLGDGEEQQGSRISDFQSVQRLSS